MLNLIADIILAFIDPRIGVAPRVRRPPGAAHPAVGRAGDRVDRDRLSVRAVTDASFERDVLRSPRPVVVDFWAPWCGPCKAVEPILTALAAEHEGVEFVRMDVDANPLTAARYGVLSLPDGDPLRRRRAGRAGARRAQAARLRARVGGLATAGRRRAAEP